MQNLPAEWKIKRLKSLSSNITSGATPNTTIEEFWENGNIPWMSSGEVNGRYINSTEKFISVNGYNKTSTSLIPKHSVLIALAGQGRTRGKVAINNIELTTNQSLAAIVPNDQLCYKYLFFYLENKYNDLRKLSFGEGGRGGLNLRILNSLPILLPPINEQKRIADILSTWDKAIELKENEKENTKKIFDRVIKDSYTNFSDMKSIRYFIRKINNADITVSNKYLEIGDVDVLNHTYILGTKNVVHGAKKSITNTILVSKVRPTRGAIVILKDDVYVSNAFCQLRIKPEHNFRYVYYALLTNKFSYDMGSLSTGSTYPTINDDDVLSFKIPNRDREDQDILANNLENLEKKIKLLNDEISLLKLQKKGLMQQLLTGKIRVQV